MFYTLKKKNAYLALKSKNIFSILFSTISYNNNNNINNLKKWFFLKALHEFIKYFKFFCKKSKNF